MKNNMRKFVMIAVLLMGVGACAYAIDYPEYKSPVMRSGVYSAQQRSNMPYTPYTPYNVSSLGGGSTTWDNNGGSRNNGNGGIGGGNGTGGYAPSGPNRVHIGPDVDLDSDGFPEDANIGDTFSKDGHIYMWTGAGWIILTDDSQQDADYNPIPVGSPVLPMLLMALLAAGAVYLRRRKALQA